MNEDSIAIERFDNFDRCIIDGLSSGIRWVSCMEAYSAVPGKSRAEVAPDRLAIKNPEQRARANERYIGSIGETALPWPRY